MRAYENGRPTEAGAPVQTVERASALRPADGEYARPMGATPLLAAIRTSEGRCDTCHSWGQHMQDCPEDPDAGERPAVSIYRVDQRVWGTRFTCTEDTAQGRHLYVVRSACGGFVYCATCRSESCAHALTVNVALGRIGQ